MCWMLSNVGLLLRWNTLDGMSSSIIKQCVKIYRIYAFVFKSLSIEIYLNIAICI